MICNMSKIFFRQLSTSFSRLKPLGIPFVIESEDIYSRLLKDRIICVMAPIDDFYAAAIIAQLLFLQSESEKSPIHMYINSPGLGIYDTMQYITAPIHTWCIGQACSMASLLLAAGKKGMRTALPNARIMIHQPSGGMQGTASDILIHAAEINRLRSSINEIYAFHTGKSPEEIADALERDKFMSATEAQEFGIIDRTEQCIKSV